MDELDGVLARGGGVALVRDLTAAGLHPNDLRAARRTGRVVRIRHGAYADSGLWQRLTPSERHAQLVRAVLAGLTQPAVASHTSAAIIHGLPVWGADLATVHVTRPKRGHGRRERTVTHHAGALTEADVEVVDGVPVTSVARTVIDMARLVGFEGGVVTADAALHSGLTTLDELRERHVAMSDWPRARVASRVIRFADRLAETPGESRTRVLFHVHGLPTPRLQVVLIANARRYRVDMLVDEPPTVVEFDGRLKYRMGESQNPRELEAVLWAEKRREDDLRAEGYRFARIIWGDLDRPLDTAARLRGILR